MLRFKIYNLAFILFLLFLPAKFALAKTLKFQDKTWEIIPNFSNFTPAVVVKNDFDLSSLVNNAILGSPMLDSQKLLTEDVVTQLKVIANDLNQPAKDAQMIIENNKATQFDPGQNGQAVDLYATLKLLNSDEIAINLPVFISLAQTTLAQTNNLGIRELVGVGVSDFSRSPNNRIHNINVGAQKFDGLIIAPGQEFSFNKYLGDVDDVHGFLPELVIKPEGVTPEFGGGLCQVSTTAFRAAMNAGFPIIARRNHSFAVQYYAPQGTDATIYPGSADLKFVNNLTSSLLIRTRVEGRKLYFDFFGTKDDRVIVFDGPSVFDKKSDGSMKAVWTRHVTVGGLTTDQTFKSTYLPPAQFHHDAVTAPSTLNPEAKPLTN